MEKCADNSSCDHDKVFDGITTDLEGLEGEKAESKDSEIADQILITMIYLAYIKEDIADARSEYETEIDNLLKLLGEEPKYE